MTGAVEAQKRKEGRRDERGPDGKPAVHVTKKAYLIVRERVLDVCRQKDLGAPVNPASDADVLPQKVEALEPVGGPAACGGARGEPAKGSPRGRAPPRPAPTLGPGVPAPSSGVRGPTGPSRVFPAARVHVGSGGPSAPPGATLTQRGGQTPGPSTRAL